MFKSQSTFSRLLLGDWLAGLLQLITVLELTLLLLVVALFTWLAI